MSAILIAVASVQPDYEGKLELLSLYGKVSMGTSAYVAVILQLTLCNLNGGHLEKCLENFDTLANILLSSTCPFSKDQKAVYYSLICDYCLKTADPYNYAKALLSLLKVKSVQQFTDGEQLRYATALGIAGLISTDIHDLTPVLQSPLMVILKSRKRWLYETLYSVHNGLKGKFKQLESDWKEMPDIAGNEEIILRKLHFCMVMRIIDNIYGPVKVLDIGKISRISGIPVHEVWEMIGIACSLNFIEVYSNDERLFCWKSLYQDQLKFLSKLFVSEEDISKSSKRKQEEEREDSLQPKKKSLLAENLEGADKKPVDSGNLPDERFIKDVLKKFYAVPGPKNVNRNREKSSVLVIIDIENKVIVKEKSFKSILTLVDAFSSGYTNVKKYSACDPFSDKAVLAKELDVCGVSVIMTDSSIKQSADAKLLEEATFFIDHVESAAMLLLVSDDGDFCNVFERCKVADIVTVLFHENRANQSLKKLADIAINITKIKDDLPLKRIKQNREGTYDILLNSFKSTFFGDFNLLRNELQLLEQYFNGKHVVENDEVKKITFKTEASALGFYRTHRSGLQIMEARFKLSFQPDVIKQPVSLEEIALFPATRPKEDKFVTVFTDPDHFASIPSHESRARKLSAELDSMHLKGAVLVGPGGSGKKSFVKSFVKLNNKNLVIVNCEEICFPLVNGSEVVKEAFSYKNDQLPLIICICNVHELEKRVSGAACLEEVNLCAQSLVKEIKCLDSNSNAKVFVTMESIKACPDIHKSLSHVLMFNLPDIHVRLEILTLHSRGLMLNNNVDLCDIAVKTGGLSCGQCKEVCIEAGLCAFQRNCSSIFHQDFLAAVAKVEEKKNFMRI